MGAESNNTRVLSGGGKHLTFELGEVVYGFDILSIREIIGVLDITPVPQSASHVLGVVNLRGKIIPVVDLRQRLGMSPCEIGARTCIVVLSMGTGKLVGAVVDAVAEVVQIPPEVIEPPPALANVGESDLVGMAKIKDRVIMLLDAARALGGVEETVAA